MPDVRAGNNICAENRTGAQEKKGDIYLADKVIMPTKRYAGVKLKHADGVAVVQGTIVPQGSVYELSSGRAIDACDQLT